MFLVFLWKFDLFSAACSKIIYNITREHVTKQFAWLQSVRQCVEKVTDRKKNFITNEFTLLLIFIIKFVFNFLSLTK